MKTLSAMSEMHGVEIRLSVTSRYENFTDQLQKFKSDFQSGISLAAGEILVSEIRKNKSYLKFLHVTIEVVVSGDHLPEQVSVEGF